MLISLLAASFLSARVHAAAPVAPVAPALVTVPAAPTDPALVAPAPAPPDLAGCKASWAPPLLTFACPDKVFVASLTAGGSADEVLNGGMTLLKVNYSVVDEVPRPGGAPLKVFTVPGSLIGPAGATSVERRPGVAEFLACSPYGARCGALLLALVDGGLPDLRPYLETWTDPVPFPGRTLTVPRGCHPFLADQAPGFVCGFDSLQGVVVNGDEEPAELLAASMQARMAAAKENNRDMKQTALADCRVDGTPGVCSLTTRPPHSPLEPRHDIVGYARRPDGVVIVANCRWGGEAAGIPAFCGQLLTWTP